MSRIPFKSKKYPKISNKNKSAPTPNSLHAQRDSPNEAALLEFDMDPMFGPFVGLSRTIRLKRALFLYGQTLLQEKLGHEFLQLMLTPTHTPTDDDDPLWRTLHVDSFTATTL